MTTRARVSLALLMLLVGACGEDGAAVPSAAPAADPWRVVAAPPPGAYLAAVVRDGDGWVAARGGRRARLAADGTLTRASEPTRREIASFEHVGDAWLTTTVGGEVFSSATPLGPLSPVGTLDGHALGIGTSSHGRLALFDARGELWVGDASGITHVVSPMPSIDAAFASETFGARITLSGAVEVTNDGGSTWSTAEGTVEGAPYETFVVSDPRAAERSGRCVALRTQAGVYLARPDAPLEAYVGELPTDVAPPDVRARFELALASRGAAASGVTTSGEYLEWAEGGVRLHGGTVVLETPSEMQDIPARAWGTRFLWRTTYGDWRVTDGRAPITVIGGAPPTTVFDSDGVHYAAEGLCHPLTRDSYRSSDPDAPVHFVCVRGGTSNVEVNIGDAATPLWLSGQTLVARREVDAEHRTIWRVDLAHPDHPIEVVLPSTLALERSSFAEDGTVAAQDRSDGHWQIGPIDALRDVTLPAGTTALRAIDALHFVATTPRGYALSGDGGRTFAPLGAAGALTPERCNARACDFGTRIWVAPAASSVFPDGAQIEGAESDDDDDLAAGAVAVACPRPPDLAGRLHTVWPTNDATDASTASIWRSEGSAVFTGSADPRAIRGVLTHVDSGALVTQRLAARLPPPSVAATDAPAEDDESREEEPVAVWPIWVAPEGMLVARGVDGAATELIALSSTGRLVAREIASVFGSAPQLGAPLSLRDGSVAVAASTELIAYDGTRGTTALVIVRGLGTDAPSIALHVVEHGPLEALVSLARDAHGAGLFILRGDVARVLRADGEIGGALPTPPRRIDTMCGAAREDDLDVVLPLRADDAGVSVAPEGGDLVLGTARGMATLRADGVWCLRTLHLVQDDGSAIDVHASDAGAPAGVLTTRTGGLDVQTPVSCRFVSDDERGGRPAVARDVFLGGMEPSTDGTVSVAFQRAGAPNDLNLLRVGQASAVSETRHASSPPASRELVPFGDGLVSSGSEPVDPSVAEVVGAGPNALQIHTRVHDATTTLSIARAGPELGPSVELDAYFRSLAVASVDLGARRMSGVLVTCATSSDEFYQEGCRMRALHLGDALVVGPPAPVSSVGELVVARGARLLVATLIDGGLVVDDLEDAAGPIGPPIASSCEADRAHVIPLALGADPIALVYIDTERYAREATHVRVVTLDAEGWRDVADPLPMRRSESARAIVDARGRIVVARTIAGGVAIDRLDGETWTHVPIDP